MRRPKIGVALGAGGARGMCHIGVLKGLEEHGISVDAVSGASIGAVVGAVYAAGRLQAFEDWATALTGFGSLALWDLRLGAGGIVEGRALRDLFDSIDMPENIEDLDLPFIAVSTDMVTGAEVWHRDGSVFDAVRASIALPGIVSPHWYQERWLLDGGLVNPIPVNAVRALHAEVVIAANPNARLDGVIWQSPESPARKTAADEGMVNSVLQVLQNPVSEAMRAWGSSSSAGPAKPGYVEVVTASVEIMMDHIQRSRLAGDPPHVMLNGTLGWMSITDFANSAAAIEEGREMVARQIEFVEALATPR